MIKPEVLLIVVVSMLATALTLIEVGKTIKPPENQSVSVTTPIAESLKIWDSIRVKGTHLTRTNDSQEMSAKKSIEVCS